MHTEIMRSLAIRHAPLFDQPHSLKLELACKLPSLHHAPPVPSKHLTRCLRNRVQANQPIERQSSVSSNTPKWGEAWHGMEKGALITPEYTDDRFGHDPASDRSKVLASEGNAGVVRPSADAVI